MPSSGINTSAAVRRAAAFAAAQQAGFPSVLDVTFTFTGVPVLGAGNGRVKSIVGALVPASTGGAVAGGVMFTNLTGPIAVNPPTSIGAWALLRTQDFGQGLGFALKDAAGNTVRTIFVQPVAIVRGPVVQGVQLHHTTIRIPWEAAQKGVRAGLGAASTQLPATFSGVEDGIPDPVRDAPMNLNGRMAVGVLSGAAIGMAAVKYSKWIRRILKMGRR
jgi:hypothetical protein